MRTKTTWILAVPLLAGWTCGQNKPSHPLPKIEIPVAKPWSPPTTTVPKEIVDRAAFLLAHGMGDPRGGEYRSAKVNIGTLWHSDGQPVEVHGWTFPAQGSNPARIVTLDGLTWTPVSIGEKVDIAKDFAGIPKTVRLGQFVATGTPDVIGLILIAGEKALAERLASGTSSPHTFRDNGFLARLFDQAVTAHMQGDDLLAYRAAKTVEKYRPDFEKESLARTGQKYTTSPTGQPLKTDEQFPYLNVLPSLIADTERRLREARKPLDPKALDKQSVQTLIHHLDEVSARQWGQPGGVNLAEDPIVAALVKIGNPAVEPLLDVIEKDTRLTRSVSFGRDFFPGRNLITVKSAAHAAFSQIADTTVFDSSYGEKMDVAGLRKFWKENGGLSSADRWFATLADDTAGKRRWMDAAGRLFDHSNVQRSGSWTTVTTGNDPGKLKAEAVRSKSNPSLSDLLARRAKQLCGSGGAHSSLEWFDCADGLRLVSMLADWDPKAALPVLKETTNRTMAMALPPDGHVTSLGQTAKLLTDALEKRATLGDPEVWTEYAQWLAKLPPMEGSSDGIKIFEPLARHPSSPAFKDISRRLFLDAGSSNSPYTMAKQHPGWNWAETMAITPLIAIPEFRESIALVLDDKTPFGDTWVDERGTLYVRHEGSSSGQGGDKDVINDPLRPKPDEKRPVRIGDSMAKALTRLKGAPKFQTYWPEAKKDEAIAQLKKFLETSAGNADAVLSWPYNWRDPRFGR